MLPSRRGCYDEITRCHGRYLQGRRALPLVVLNTGPLNPSDTKFQALKALDKYCSPLTRAPGQQSISDGSLRPIYSRSVRVQDSHKEQEF